MNKQKLRERIARLAAENDELYRRINALHGDDATSGINKQTAPYVSHAWDSYRSTLEFLR